MSQNKHKVLSYKMFSVCVDLVLHLYVLHTGIHFLGSPTTGDNRHTEASRESE